MSSGLRMPTEESFLAVERRLESPRNHVPKAFQLAVPSEARSSVSISLLQNGMSICRLGLEKVRLRPGLRTAMPPGGDARPAATAPRSPAW
jgi:hypothetical protein